jgi:hypothetical protein
VLVVGPPDYDKPCEEDLLAIQGSPSKRVQAIADREQARLWRQQQARIEDQKLRDRFNQVTVVAPPGYLEHPPSPPSNRRQSMSREIPAKPMSMRASKLAVPENQSALTSYAIKIVESIFAPQSTTSKVKMYIKGMIDMAEVMNVTAYMMNRAVKRAHRNSHHSSKPFGLCFALDKHGKVVSTISDDAPMVLRRMKLERGLVQVGRIEPPVGSASILRDVTQPPSLYRAASIDSTETFIYEPGDAPIMDRSNSFDSTRTLDFGSVVGPPGDYGMPH